MEEPSSQYTVLARRYRPQSFAEVVGQGHIGQALRNAICSGRVAHAYLFTGARGVGKTSTARILAKALNCPHAQDGVPCNRCDICDAVTAGSDVDVLEIDGASNRGIDDVRTLRSNVNVRSMRSPYKVYIIDEVHMLTKEAFNALLKTLEEPPQNVKFVFCTTEPNKVPDTILSRCQRFDFGAIAPADIASRLEEIARLEGVSVDPAAVELVSRRAAGSLRDSQSLFDQLLAFGAERITVADVNRLLGAAPDDRLHDIVGALVDGDRRAALERIDAAILEGVQIGVLVDQLLNYLRDLLICAVDADAVPLLAVAPGMRPRLSGQARQWGVHAATAAMQVLIDCRARMQRSTAGRALLDLAIVRMALLNELQSVGALLEHLNGAEASRPPAATHTSVARRVPASTPPGHSAAPGLVGPSQVSASQGAATIALPAAPATMAAAPGPTTGPGPHEAPTSPARSRDTGADPVTESAEIAPNSQPQTGPAGLERPTPAPIGETPAESTAGLATPGTPNDPGNSAPHRIPGDPSGGPRAQLGPPGRASAVRMPDPESSAGRLPLADASHRQASGTMFEVEPEAPGDLAIPSGDSSDDSSELDASDDSSPAAWGHGSDASAATAVPTTAAPTTTASAGDPSAFTPGTASEFWSQLIAKLPDTIRTHAQNLSQCAISGPDSLELVVPTRYFLNGKYLQQTEVLARMETEASFLAGRPIRIRFSAESVRPSSTATSNRNKSYERRPTASADRDPFVQQVLGVFGGSVIEVRRLAAEPDSQAASREPGDGAET